jgi:hypothetical protein
VINFTHAFPLFAKAPWRLVIEPFSGEPAANTIFESMISATASL